MNSIQIPTLLWLLVEYRLTNAEWFKWLATSAGITTDVSWLLKHIYCHLPKSWDLYIPMWIAPLNGWSGYSKVKCTMETSRLQGRFVREGQIRGVLDPYFYVLHCRQLINFRCRPKVWLENKFYPKKCHRVQVAWRSQNHDWKRTALFYQMHHALDHAKYKHVF